jgi:hypothetical protein
VLIWPTLEICFSRPPFLAIRERVRLLVKQREQDPTQFWPRMSDFLLFSLKKSNLEHNMVHSNLFRPRSRIRWILIWKTVFRQQWTGWPEGVGEDVTLAQSEIARAHTLTVNQVIPPGTIRSFLRVLAGRSSGYKQVVVQARRSSRYNQVVPPGTIRSFLQVQSGHFLGTITSFLQVP